MKKPNLSMLGIVIIAIFNLVLVLADAQASPQSKGSIEHQLSKERLVLMPLRVPVEDKILTGAMETALVEGLQLKYDVFSGEQVSQKAHQIFLKESRNVAHAECDETRCMQNIAEAFQSELIATANVTKQDGTYFLALSIQNIFDNKVVYSKSSPCEGCNAAQVVNKLKKLSGALFATEVPLLDVEDAQQKAHQDDPDATLWAEVQKGNAVDDYQVYLDTYPKGKFIPLAKARIKKLKGYAQVLADQQEQNAWDAAQKENSDDSYGKYLTAYPSGRYIATASAKLKSIKEEAAKIQLVQAAEAERQKREAAARQRGFVSQGGLTWMPVIDTRKNWPDANAYCTNSAIKGQAGWRLPKRDELKALYDSGLMKNQEWTLSFTWSSSPDGAVRHGVVGLDFGGVGAARDTVNNYVTCVR